MCDIDMPRKLFSSSEFLLTYSIWFLQHLTFIMNILPRTTKPEALEKEIEELLAEPASV